MDTKCFISVFIVVFGLLLVIQCDKSPTEPTNPSDMPYKVSIDPADFVNENITGNDFFPLNPGTTLIYEGEDERRHAVRVEEKVTSLTKTVMGVTCVVVEAREFEEGDLIEDTQDWYAQDKEGNVWYFGEYSEVVKDGEVVSTSGSWEAGVEGALPGIIMLANPIAGLWYRQEYDEGEAEDVAQVLSLIETVTVPYGTCTDCLQTAEWNPLEKGIIENKYYAAGVGLLRAVAVKGENGYEDLIEITVE